MKKQKKRITPQVITQNEQVRKTVEQYEAVANFLRNLTDQVSAQAGSPAEVVKAMTLSRLFLEEQSRQARVQYAGAFEEQPEVAAV